MTDATPLPDLHPRLDTLTPSRSYSFSLMPDAEARRALAAELGILGVRKLRFEGELRPVGKRDWTLAARLGATVEQPCVVTLAPVVTRIDEDVTRQYLTDATPPDTPGEVEMPEDDSIEPRPDVLDLNAVMAEALALALPTYPRAPDAELGATLVTEPGIAPLTDEAARPFAGLGALRDKLGKTKE